MNMKQSKLIALALAVGTFAMAQTSSAVTATGYSNFSPYGCQMLDGNAQNTPGGYYSGYLYNVSGSANWVVCPVPQEIGNGATMVITIVTSASATCALGKTSTSATTPYQVVYVPPTSSSNSNGAFSYTWTLSQVDYLYYNAYEIQCYIPNQSAVYEYESVIGN